jgi:hypothetical protein
VRHSTAFLLETYHPSGHAVSAGGEKPYRINSSVVFPSLGMRRHITNKPLPYKERHYQLTLYHYRGSYRSYFIFYASGRALYQKAFLISRVVRKLKFRFIAEAGNRSVQGVTQL